MNDLGFLQIISPACAICQLISIAIRKPSRHCPIPKATFGRKKVRRLG